MILSSTLNGLLQDLQEARRLTALIAQVRAMEPGQDLGLAVPGDQPALSPLGLSLPAPMVVEGLVKQLHLVIARLAAGGIRFDEAEPADLPAPPVKRGRPRGTGA